MSGLSFSELSMMNAVRNARWFGEESLERWSLSDWGIAAAGELGKALNIIKKLNRSAAQGLPGNNSPDAVLEDQLASEIADVVIYLDLLAQRAGIDLGSAVERSFNRKSQDMGFPERIGGGRS